jgi:hypothetical protein
MGNPAMRTLRALEPVTAVLMGVLLIALLLAAAAFFFVGVINAEDWFFGTKLDGPPAFLYLLIKALGASVLVYSIILHPRFIRPAGVLTAAYFGYLFMDSTVTIRTTTGGARPFSGIVLVLFVLSLLFVVFQRIAPLRDLPSEKDRA